MRLPDEYEDRFCAYVDILGFRSLIDGVHQGNVPFDRVRNALRTIHTPPTDVMGFDASEFRAQSISDAVVISTAPNHDGIYYLFIALEALTFELLAAGFLLRGAITYGRLYHKDQTVFGEALIDAYRLETDVARFPRIMIARRVAEIVRNFESKHAFRQLVRQAEDGPFFLHTLLRMSMQPELITRSHADGDPTADKWLGVYADISRTLQRLFDESVDNPRHFEKVQWFARYWNQTLGTAPADKFGRITGPGLSDI